jgi:hypothetical protein
MIFATAVKPALRLLECCYPQIRPIKVDPIIPKWDDRLNVLLYEVPNIKGFRSHETENLNIISYYITIYCNIF